MGKKSARNAVEKVSPIMETYSYCCFFVYFFDMDDWLQASVLKVNNVHDSSNIT